MKKFNGSLFFLFAIGLSIIQFYPWMPKVFYGDDLMLMVSYQDGDCSTRLGQVLTTTCYDKFRPLSAAFNSILMNRFDLDVWKYMTVNILLQAFIATLFASIAWLMSKRDLLSTLFLGAAVAVSRFATFPIVVANGPYELLAVPLLLGILWCVYRSDRHPSDSWRFGWIALALFIPLVLTHERYIVTAVWLCLTFTCLPNFRALSRIKRLSLQLSSLSLPIIFVGYKAIFLRSPFFVGTGGSEIKLNVSMIARHIYEAVLSILGINEGPAYLAGSRLMDMPWLPVWIFPMLMIACLILIFYIGVRSIFSERRKEKIGFIELRFPILLILLALFLLVPPILTIRLEQRWLFLPFLLTLLTFSWVMGKVDGRKKKLVLLSVLTFSINSILLDVFVMKSYGNTFYVHSSKFAEMVKRDVIDGSTKSSESIYFVASPDMCSWVLRDGDFFRIYQGERRKIQCIESGDNGAIGNLDSKFKVYSEVIPGKLMDITAQWLSRANSHRETVNFDFVADFKKGKINSTAEVGTPTKLGALTLNRETLFGSESALIVLPGFSYEFNGIQLKNNSQLRFDVSLIYPVEVQARALIYIIDELTGKKSVLFTKEIAWQNSSGKLLPTPVVIPLDSFNTRSVSIIFSLETIGDTSSVWLGYFKPRIVTPPKPTE